MDYDDEYFPEEEYEIEDGLILDICGLEMDNEATAMYALMHSGTPQRYDFDPQGSGRYRQGSGDNPYQHATNFISRCEKLKAEGFSETEIAEQLGFKSKNAYIAAKSLSTHAIDAQATREIIHMYYDLHLSKREIARRVYGDEKKDTTVGNKLKQINQDRASSDERVKELLRQQVAEKGMIDVGKGVERTIDISTENTPIIGITSSRLNRCLKQLEDEGYFLDTDFYVVQTGTGYRTKMKVLCKPGTTHDDVKENRADIGTIDDYFIDNGLTRLSIQPPTSIDVSRVAVNYAEDGGTDSDGTMYIRRGVKDLSLGQSHYAQVRIAVNDTHYLKGMAMYGDDKMFPEGVDVIFNTNKHKGTPIIDIESEKMDKGVLKPLKDDPDNPFGATIKHSYDKNGKLIIGQSYYDDPNGKYVKIPDMNGYAYVPDDGTHGDLPHLSLNAVNKINEEGDWGEWSKTISTQFLSKQPMKVIEKQLDITYANKRDEFDEIMSISQPEIKKKLLEDFAESCDSDAVDLKAAGFQGQQSHVILPVPSMPDNEIYAPHYDNGTHVILVRYPHAGTFEIPELVVNNNRQDAIDILGRNPKDAVGINPKTAAKLSGADFDGDTVQVIPSDRVDFEVRPSLKGLEDFDPGIYKGYEGMPVMTDQQKGLEMGKISNLITDMTLIGAPDEHMERAVKHSMVVIDAQKHKYDWQASFRENDIQELYELYQRKPGGGASTLISKAHGDFREDPHDDYAMVVATNPDGTVKMTTDKNGNQVAATKRLYIDPETGKKLRTYRKETYEKYVAYEYDENGKKKKDADGKTIEIELYKKYKDPDTKEKFDIPKFYDKDGNPYTGDLSLIKTTVANRTVTTTKMGHELAEKGTAAGLSSGHPKEELYVKLADNMYNLGNEARLASLDIEYSKVDKESQRIYADEIASINHKIAEAEKNAPRERQALLYANDYIYQLRKANPSIEKETLKKKKQQALSAARAKFGAKKKSIVFTDKEWEAIQAGAISSTKLRDSIIPNCDLDKLKERALPRDRGISESKQARIRALSNNNWTIAQIAKYLDIPDSTVAEYVS